MVSHIDDDHIGGAARQLTRAQGRPGPARPGRAGACGTTRSTTCSRREGRRRGAGGAAGPAKAAEAVASVAQGRSCASDAEPPRLAAQRPVRGARRWRPSREVPFELDDHADGRRAPTRPARRPAQGVGEQVARCARRRRAAAAEVAEYLDESPFNLSSIVVPRRGRAKALDAADRRRPRRPRAGRRSRRRGARRAARSTWTSSSSRTTARSATSRRTSSSG